MMLSLGFRQVAHPVLEEAETLAAFSVRVTATDCPIFGSLVMLERQLLTFTGPMVPLTRHEGTFWGMKGV